MFDSSKVTDHHAIIPTGVAAHNLTDMERNVYDLVVRRFISVFYPDCRFATTTVQGQAADVPFRATGRLILEPGWRAVPPRPLNSRKSPTTMKRKTKPNAPFPIL